MAELRDQYGRRMRKLRISVTDRCNLRCFYCMPENPEWKPRSEILNFDEILRLARIFVRDLGIRQIRLTGGEPLLRRSLETLIALLSEKLRPLGLRRISLTTNGVLLPEKAWALKEAGLDDLNVSLDALSPDRFRAITLGGDVAKVIRGIQAAREAGLGVKLNAVVIRGVNDGEELLRLTRWAMEQDLPLRFIEFMPLDGKGVWAPEKVVTGEEILRLLEQDHTVEPLPTPPSEPARYYALDRRYRIGIIPTISAPFCHACDRLRLTADGKLVLCLFSGLSTDLKAPLRSGADDAELARYIRKAVFAKPKGYLEWRENQRKDRLLPMHVMGG